MRKFWNSVIKHELYVAVLLFSISFLSLWLSRKSINSFSGILIGLSWVAAILFVDFLNRKFEFGGSLWFRRKQLNRLFNIVAASFFMNLISDITGSWLTRLWHYPKLNPIFYLLFLAPLGYIAFGSVLYLTYRFFKNVLDKYAKRGRDTTLVHEIYNVLLKYSPFIFIPGLIVGLTNLYLVMKSFDFYWLNLSLNSGKEVNIIFFLITWFSIFLSFEYLNYLKGRETLIHDLLRGDFVPLYSIILSSIICVIVVELFNYPFQIWRFSNWPMDNQRLFEIPLVAYFLWPMQYLLLIPLLRFLDSSNQENVL